ncbi:hypothetical protein A2U01_0109324, partial [Trifolium medium]|nr:hypothetical protein [Trifolium medium]
MVWKALLVVHCAGQVPRRAGQQGWSI